MFAILHFWKRFYKYRPYFTWCFGPYKPREISDLTIIIDARAPASNNANLTVSVLKSNHRIGYNVELCTTVIDYLKYRPKG